MHEPTKPLPDTCQHATHRQLLAWMFSFLKPVKILVVLACLYLTLWTGAEILGVRMTAKAVDQIQAIHTNETRLEAGAWSWITSHDPDAAGLRRIVLILAALTVALGILRYLREVANAKLSMEMVFYIREAVYDKLQRAGFGFHDAISTGELINRSLSDLQNVRSFINSAVLITLEIVLIVGGYIALLLSRSTWVAALALVPLPFWIGYTLKFSRRAQPAIEAAMKAGDNNISLITENIAGVHVVKGLAMEGREIAKYNRNCDEFFARVMRRIRIFANFTPVIRSIATASHLTLFLTAGVLIIKGRLNAGDILMLGSAMGAILGRLQQIAVVNEQYQSAIVSARRLQEVIMAKPIVAERQGARVLPPGTGAVRLDHVTFGYDPHRPVLCDVTLDVAGGQVVAIIGPTGAGKTTLVSLIARFYDPQQGRVLIDGTDVRDVTLDCLRRQVAYVFQETFLFSASVESNIAYGRPISRGGPVEAAARLAQAHEFVESLPRGYATMLGERGFTLSGGQRQRLAIARALHADARILVLDDATAAVDPETENDIRQAMRRVMTDRTTFVIAHRISTVKRADLVVVIENGRITQMGTHKELMARKGHYRQIVYAQLYGDVDYAPPRHGSSHLDRMRDLERTEARPVRVKEVSDETTVQPE